MKLYECCVVVIMFHHPGTVETTGNVHVTRWLLNAVRCTVKINLIALRAGYQGSYTYNGYD